MQLIIQSYSYVECFSRNDIIIPTSAYRSWDCLYSCYKFTDKKTVKKELITDTSYEGFSQFLLSLKLLSPIPDKFSNSIINWKINEPDNSPIKIKQNPFYEFFIIMRKLLAGANNCIAIRWGAAKYLANDFLAFDSIAEEIFSVKNYEFYQEFLKLFLLGQELGLILFQTK